MSMSRRVRDGILERERTLAVDYQTLSDVDVRRSPCEEAVGGYAAWIVVRTEYVSKNPVI